MVLQTRVGETDFYLITDNNLSHPVYLLGFMHTEDKTKDQIPYIAEKIYVGGTFITEMKGYVTKENVYADKRTDIIFVPSVLDITGTKNLYAEDPNEMTQNYAGWAAIVPADPKANTPEKAKISDSIYVIYPEGSNKTSGEMNNISTLKGYGV